MIFLAWKKLHTDSELKELGEQFEQIERRTFGHDGFDDVVRNIAQIENELGLGDLDRFTAPAIRA